MVDMTILTYVLVPSRVCFVFLVLVFSGGLKYTGQNLKETVLQCNIT